MSPADQLVLAGDEGAVRTLTLNRPSRLNAFTADSYRLLATRLDEADADDGVHAVLLCGAGRAFCSGVDLDVLGHTFPGSDLRGAFDRLMGALTAFTKPLLAAVHGPAVGIGATILLHCDAVLVAEGARLRFPFTSMRTAPEAGSTFLLPEVVGPQRAAELLFTSRWVSAPEAVAMGLALRCCPPEGLRDEASELAQAMAAQTPAAVVAARRLLRHGRAEAVRAAVERELREAERLGETLGPFGRP